MANNVGEWSPTAGSNTSLGAVSLQENIMLVNSVNNAFREMMAQVATGISGNALMAAYAPATASGAAYLDFKEDTDNGTNRVRLQGPASTADVTVTLPAATDTLVGRDTTDTLTNKTLTTPTITLKQGTGPTPTAEGDVQWDTDDNAIVVGDGAGQKVFRPNAWELISTQVPSGVASVSWTSLSAFRALRLTGFVRPGTDAVGIGLRTSVDNGLNYDAGTGYTNHDWYSTSTTTTAAVGTTDSAVLLYQDTIGSAAEEGIAFSVVIEQFNQATFSWFLIDSMMKNTAGAIYRIAKASYRNSATARDALQFLVFSGVITGTVTLEGIRG